MPICRTSVKASKRMVYARTSERTRAIRFERPRARRRAAAARWPQEGRAPRRRSEEHTSELQSQSNLVCRLLLEKKKRKAQRDLGRQRSRMSESKSLAIPTAF